MTAVAGVGEKLRAIAQELRAGAESTPCDGCGMPATRRCPYCNTTACADCQSCDHDAQLAEASP